MGMTTKSGKYFANPALGRAHESAESGGKSDGGKTNARERGESEPAEPKPHGGAHSVHIFVDDTGAHHTVAHHAHGVEHEEHGSLDEAMDHAKAQMGGDDAEPREEGGGSAPNADGLMATLGGGGY